MFLRASQCVCGAAEPAGGAMMTTNNAADDGGSTGRKELLPPRENLSVNICSFPGREGGYAASCGALQLFKIKLMAIMLLLVVFLTVVAVVEPQEHN